MKNDLPLSSSATDDTLDIFAALAVIWLALEAVRQTLPPPQEAKVATAVDSLAEIMGRLMRRHQITVSLGGDGEESSI